MCRFEFSSTGTHVDYKFPFVQYELKHHKAGQVETSKTKPVEVPEVQLSRPNYELYQSKTATKAICVS